MSEIPDDIGQIMDGSSISVVDFSKNILSQWPQRLVVMSFFLCYEKTNPGKSANAIRFQISELQVTSCEGHPGRYKLGI